MSKKPYGTLSRAVFNLIVDVELVAKENGERHDYDENHWIEDHILAPPRCEGTPSTSLDGENGEGDSIQVAPDRAAAFSTELAPPAGLRLHSKSLCGGSRWSC
jgi:hypothetical protein